MRINRHTLEMAVALVITVAAAVTLYGSAQLETGWGTGGPDSGYFPYRLGWFLLLVGVLLLARSWRQRMEERGEIFATAEQLRRSAALFVPSALLVLAMPWLGTYVASALFLAGMSRRHGGCSWLRAITLALVVMVIFFGVFELWFNVPLVKGPLEDWLLGY